MSEGPKTTWKSMRKTPKKLDKSYQNLLAQSESLKRRGSSSRDQPPIPVVPIATAPPRTYESEDDIDDIAEYIESTFADNLPSDEAEDEGLEEPIEEQDDEEEHGTTPDPSSTGISFTN